MTNSNKTLVKSDLVLITGGTGWVGSHIVEQSIIHGLRVRLAIRSKEKAERLIKALKEKYGQSIHLETIEVKDFAVEGAYDEAVKDVQGIVHTASNLNFTNNYDQIVNSSLRGYELLLEAVHKQGKAIKRVVITSSSIALGSPSVLPNEPEQHFTTETWNDTDLKEANHQPTSWNVYAASKVLSERYTRNFVRENNCEFVLNIINPNACYGAKVVGTEYMSTGTWVRKGCLEADEGIVKTVKSQYHVDVDDVGLLHVLALTREDIVNERILAFGELFTWDQLFEMTKRLAPEKYNPAAKTEVTAQRDRTTVDLTRTQEILKPYGGLKSLEHSVRLNLQD